MGSSNSNLPSFRFSQRDRARLSRRNQACDIELLPLLIKGWTKKEMLFARVPPVRILMEEVSKPEVATLVSTWPAETLPAILSTATRSLLSRCHCGVTRNAMGQYSGC